jgi:hypothetical protein
MSHSDHFTTEITEELAQKLFMDGGDAKTHTQMAEEKLRQKIEEEMLEKRMKLDYELKVESGDSIPSTWFEVVGDPDLMAQWYFERYKHMDMFTPFFWYEVAREQLGNPITQEERTRARRIEKKLRKLLRKEQAKKLSIQHRGNPKKLKKALAELDRLTEARQTMMQEARERAQDSMLMPVPARETGVSGSSHSTDIDRQLAECSIAEA